jgi:two-component system LytT family response regulator
LVSKKLIEFEKLESIGRFMRLHRSYIVNLNHIKAISKKNGYTVEMINGHEVPVSKEKIKDLNDNIVEPKF